MKESLPELSPAPLCFYQKSNNVKETFSDFFFEFSFHSEKKTPSAFVEMMNCKQIGRERF